MANTKSRKYQLTFNNPLEHNYSHDVINEKMKNISWDYYCLCDEVGENGTPHTHLFFCCKNAVSVERVRKLFPNVHYELAKGSCQENKDYIRKEGKYINSDKKETNIIETFEEYGVMPLDKSVKNQTVSEQVLEMIKSGYSNSEIVTAYPSFTTKIHHIDTTRQMLLEEEYKTVFRNVEVIYIFGATATGKTRYVMEKYGYQNVYKISKYANPFDGYKGQDIILFDEFRSSLPLSDISSKKSLHKKSLQKKSQQIPLNLSKEPPRLMFPTLPKDFPLKMPNLLLLISMQSLLPNLTKI